MKCEMCSKHNAIIQIQQIVNNKKRSVRLCEDCAKMLGILGEEPDDKSKLTIPNLFSNIFDGAKHEHVHSTKKCLRCGTTLRTIMTEQKVGCTDCYKVFGPQIEKIVHKVFGNTRHIGKFPKRFLMYKQFLQDINDLKKQLKTAVKDEDYENAAILRDKINNIKDSNW
jgi:protein arginine kinase activator